MWPDDGHGHDLVVVGLQALDRGGDRRGVGQRRDRAEEVEDVPAGGGRQRTRHWRRGLPGPVATVERTCQTRPPMPRRDGPHRRASHGAAAVAVASGGRRLRRRPSPRRARPPRRDGRRRVRAAAALEQRLSRRRQRARRRRSPTPTTRPRPTMSCSPVSTSSIALAEGHRDEADGPDPPVHDERDRCSPSSRDGADEAVAAARGRAGRDRGPAADHGRSARAAPSSASRASLATATRRGRRVSARRAPRIEPFEPTRRCGHVVQPIR